MTWTCPVCHIEWPVNDKGFAVTCACKVGTADATEPQLEQKK